MNLEKAIGSADSCEGTPNLWRRFRLRLAAPVNGASLAVFRIAFGLIMALEAFTLCRPSQSAGGAIPLQVYYTGSNVDFSFPYRGFEWLPLLPPAWVFLIVGVLALSGLAMALGLFYRASASLVFLAWAYLYAVESTRTYWMSYYYLELLIAFLMIWMPAANRWSADARRSGKASRNGEVPYWTLILLRGQLLIAYFYAGVAKLNADWMLDAQPVRYYLSQPRVTQPFQWLPSGLFQWVEGVLRGDAFAYFLSWAGAAFDLGAGFLLLFRRTRILGLTLLVIFHSTNHFILFEDIEWFPLVGVATALIFLDPDWPGRFWNGLKRPRFAAPDWPWLIGGAVLIPGIGAALGWKLKKSPNPPNSSGLRPAGKCAASFVCVWLVWQALMPLRQYAIPGDARFTFEGLSFSWRLKAEVYRSMPCKIFVEDPAIVSTNEAEQTTIDWTHWSGERIIYRSVDPLQVDWPQMPEIALLFDPTIGERIVYNPVSQFAEAHPREAEARTRVFQIWRDLHGRDPEAIHRAIPLSKIVDGFATAMQKRGVTYADRKEALAALYRKHGREGDGQMIPALRRQTPFALEGRQIQDVPFLVIEDPPLFEPDENGLPRIRREAWKGNSDPALPKQADWIFRGGETLLLHLSQSAAQDRAQFPQACLFASPSASGLALRISWDYMRELTYSKGMHISTQPFLLRQYARRLAEQWNKDYGRRPAIHAETTMSFNFRPFQQYVDPGADLASVSSAWFRHNPWIKQLEHSRIPGEPQSPPEP